jgi:ergothioneine biosynthesis protein EgtB
MSLHRPLTRTDKIECPLAEHYSRVRARSLELAAPLSDEDCQVQSMPDASPTKWHLAHITWFFETFILERFETDFKAFDPAYRVLFNSYYEGVGERFPRPQRGLITRPTLIEVKCFRADVDRRMLAVLAARGDDVELQQLVTLGLHHEQQHQELLLTDIKHALSMNPVARAYAQRWPLRAVKPQPLQWLRCEGGLFELGHDPAQDGAFCFDNETPRHRAYTADFEIASRPVSNGDWLAFIADGGYRRPELWLSLGWDWVRSGEREAPFYWRRIEGSERWEHHTLQGRVELDPNTPVCHLSYFEADACARWAGARLPTEGEWELAARRFGCAPQAQDNFSEHGAFHPLPAAEATVGTPRQMFGDVWEWTQSSYSAYPGYKPLPGAVGEYNGKFMCQQYVLRGGSCATPTGHVRASYRNFFPPEAQWQFTGVRLARDVPGR